MKLLRTLLFIVLLPISLRAYTAAITVNAGSVVGDMPTIVDTGVSVFGLSFSRNGSFLPSLGTLALWDSATTIEGSYNLMLPLHGYWSTYGTTLEDYRAVAEYLRDQEAIVFVYPTGPVTEIGDHAGHPSDWYKYPPVGDDTTGYKRMIYNEVKWFAVPNDSVSDSLLFGDTEFHSTVGFGENGIVIGHWMIYHGVDDYAFQGTSTAYKTLWRMAQDTLNVLESTYSLDLKYTGWEPSDIDSAWGAGGWVDEFIEYCNVHALEMDYFTYQFHHPDPWSVSMPNTGSNFWQQARSYLDDWGYTSAKVMAGEWNGQFRVTGLKTETGHLLGTSSAHNGLDRQCEIDAALVPARIIDLYAVGQEHSFREHLQDTREGTNLRPFFYDDGQAGVLTAGLEEEGYIGLRKPYFNVFEMISRLDGKRLSSGSNRMKILNNQGTVNAIATKDLATGTISILLWTYFSPLRYINYDPSSPTTVDYYELYSLIETDLGSPRITAQITISGLTSGSYRQQRFLMDRDHSNGWRWRNQVCCATKRVCCRYWFWMPEITVRQVNHWVPSNNRYRASVGLEQTMNQISTLSSTYNLSIDLLPYSVMLIELIPQ